MRNKIKIFLLSFFLFIVLDLNAQVSGTINYELTKKDDNLEAVKSHTVIYFNDSKSIEFPLKANVTNHQSDATTEVVVVKSKRKTFIYKDFAKKKMILSDRVDRNQYLINDSLQIFKWKITKEKKKILNYICIKAITQFRGRNYEAWFTEEIPIQNGPWKFCGLPGLIIRVYDDKQAFVYQLTALDLKAKFDKNIIVLPNEYMKDKPISHREFMVLYNMKLKDYDKLSKVVHTSKNGDYGTVSIILPEKMEKF